MSKKKGIITLVCVIAFLLAGTWTAVFGLDSAKTGSAANIKQGLDLAGGVSISRKFCSEREHRCSHRRWCWPGRPAGRPERWRGRRPSGCGSGRGR